MWIPTFKLYASNGTSLIYTFEHVQNIVGWPSDQPSNIEITNLRSQGSINIPGGQKSYDITLQGIFCETDYTSLTTKLFALKTTILSNTNYILKLDKSETTTDDIHVTRIVPITFEDSYRLNFQKYTVIFKALSW
jgi:hypothetical protein